MIRIMLAQQTQNVFDEKIKKRATKVAKSFDAKGFHVYVINSRIKNMFFVSITSQDATLTMGESYAGDIIAGVQSAGIPLVIAQVRFNREDSDMS